MTNKPSVKRRPRWSQRPADEGWRRRMYDIIFEADDPAGKWFDIGLLLAILASITIVSLETMPAYRENGALLNAFELVEWVLTGLFTIEYALRLACVRRPMRYAFSFWGIIDLLSILPSYITIFIGPSSRSFVILRSIRLLRVFRVLKLWRMMDEADELSNAIWRARNKIIVFVVVVLVAVTISGTLMFHIEALTADGINTSSQFTSIPQSMYWAIVTMTTVGYGDVVPQTAAGKMISAVLILLGYSLIIVPSTFVSAEFVNQATHRSSHPCHHCEAYDQREDATYCYRCGKRLDG
ncbi:ion transporter [Rubripirellula sp.]|nr:ion transporter [Rubripirellula sp.]